MADLISTLVEMRNGEVVMDMNRKFDELLAAILATATKGTLTLKLTVAPSKLAMGGTVVEVEATHDCQIKKPELATGRSMFFVAPDGRSLMRDDPAQTAMFGVEEVQHNG